MYAGGQGVTAARAVAQFAQAAVQGHVKAQYNLGVMYERDRGVVENQSCAAELLAQAAAQGYALAQLNLGKMYVQGRGVAQDERRAAVLFRLPAAQGIAEAQFNLGNLYRDSRGLDQNDSCAVVFLSTSSRPRTHRSAVEPGQDVCTRQRCQQGRVACYRSFSVKDSPRRSTVSAECTLIMAEVWTWTRVVLLCSISKQPIKYSTRRGSALAECTITTEASTSMSVVRPHSLSR